MTATYGNDLHLAWFLGPKAENAETLEKLLLMAVRDYVHWRRNYFPGDRNLVTRTLKREHSQEEDSLIQHVQDMLAELRRNFPFYSPRYMAHMLSDVSLPSLIGYVAGMLYNPNNVTPEAAPVTVDWEIEACGRILEMLGYKVPPSPPITREDLEDVQSYYIRRGLSEFGWAHITSGGTVANIEALWAARTVRYLPLSILDVARTKNLNIQIKLPKGDRLLLKDVPEDQLLLIKPNEAIYLLAKYVDAVRHMYNLSPDKSEEASDRAWALLEESENSLSRGIGRVYERHPPVLFASGAAHYSIRKAADVLGIGRGNVVRVNVDAMLRIDPNDLHVKLREAIKDGRVPLAVIVNVGTTEEGAVDPVHRVVDLRKTMEKKENVSFWLHIDAAWGGFIRSLFNLEKEEIRDATMAKMAGKLGVGFSGRFDQWHQHFEESVWERLVRKHVPPEIQKKVDRAVAMLSQLSVLGNEQVYRMRLVQLLTDLKEDLFAKERYELPDDDCSWTELVQALKAVGSDLAEEYDRGLEGFHQALTLEVNRHVQEKFIPSELRRKVMKNLRALESELSVKAYDKYVSRLQRFVYAFRSQVANGIKKDDLHLGLQDRTDLIGNFVWEHLELRYKAYRKTLDIRWGSGEVCSAFMAFPQADSITTDPHKLGYTPYPCGVIAFRNDRVRHFILQKAPYITSVKQSALVHLPPRHTQLNCKNRSSPTVVTESFGPFILEGSKPGASASSLWLATEVIPLTMRRHGLIVRASLLGARALYEWLVHWNTAVAENNESTEYEFIPLTKEPPPTNIVNFVVKLKEKDSVELMNQFTAKVYEQFSIQSELGEHEYSYAQPFFLSKTSLTPPEYPYEALCDFFSRSRIRTSASEYGRLGIVVLRATVMSPYLCAQKARTGQDLMLEFLLEINDASKKAAALRPNRVDMKLEVEEV